MVLKAMSVCMLHQWAWHFTYLILIYSRPQETPHSFPFLNPTVYRPTLQWYLLVTAGGLRSDSSELVEEINLKSYDSPDCEASGLWGTDSGPELRDNACALPCSPVSSAENKD